MSKTSSEALEIVFQHLLKSALFTDPKRPKGNLYKRQRPAGSKVEDVVINTLILNRLVIQEGVLNVNLYVPNLVLNTATGVDTTQPNNSRLLELSILANAALEEIWATDGSYTFQVQQDHTFEDTNNQHYQNFRIEFTAVNMPAH